MQTGTLSIRRNFDDLIFEKSRQCGMEIPMKQITVACLVIVLIGPVTSNSVWARGGGYGGGHYGGGWGGHYGGGHYGGGWGYGHGGNYGHSSFGFYFGAPLYPYYSYPYYYPPSIITVPATPPVYIQQSPPAAQQNPPGYWYYCTYSEGYYPYIKECPNGWQQVAPIPPAPSSPR